MWVVVYSLLRTIEHDITMHVSSHVECHIHRHVQRAPNSVISHSVISQPVARAQRFQVMVQRFHSFPHVQIFFRQLHIFGIHLTNCMRRSYICMCLCLSLSHMQHKLHTTHHRRSSFPPNILPVYTHLTPKVPNCPLLLIQLPAAAPPPIHSGEFLHSAAALSVRETAEKLPTFRATKFEIHYYAYFFHLYPSIDAAAYSGNLHKFRT